MMAVYLVGFCSLVVSINLKIKEILRGGILIPSWRGI